MSLPLPSPLRSSTRSLRLRRGWGSGCLSQSTALHQLPVSARMVKRYLQSLQQKGKLQRIGAKRGAAGR
ncbi:FaeA/PapI family transcriptional regulator [Kosakonia cowanii]|uniref:FaeA/PapI family transcriptional regulator n=1 Tax=Kosakonia cowanii TaxID=208223 RepID=UPI0023FA0578|nr:FaeA/PapI family transcriptional regulator [Kosakonia cowanii]MDF7759158.1 FaeA/PapI family transcriptional regulator [Kosakonia cowanii]